MESWFATLKKEKLYQLDMTKLTVEQVKTIVWRYAFAYYNTKRITTGKSGRFVASRIQGKDCI